MQNDKIYVPWRERAFVSLEEAAQITSRSSDWIRERLRGGMLRGARRRGGPMVVAVPSLIELIAEFEPVAPESIPPQPPKLRLIVDNTQ